MVELPPRLCVTTPCVPAGIVVFCPLGIWIASQSRVNVNSVFSYMAFLVCHSERSREISRFIFGPAMSLWSLGTIVSYYATIRETDEWLRGFETLNRWSFVLASRDSSTALRFARNDKSRTVNTHRACNACRS